MREFNNIHQNNKKCYREEVLHFDSGLFDDSVDMAYVITMENSPRISSFMNQLNTFKPASVVTIQYNQGYKKCQKYNVDSSAYDIADALRNIFVNALEKKYQRILVFEDDFFMDKTKYTDEDIQKINTFIKRKNPHVYNLGSIAHISYPGRKHPKAILYGMAHAVIYNKKYMQSFIKDAYKKNIKHVDQYWNSTRFKKYSYKYPIVFQTWPETENMKDWGWTWKITNKWLKYWKLDKSNEHYQAHWHASWWIPWYTIIGITFVLGIIVCYCIKKYKKTNITKSTF